MTQPVQFRQSLLIATMMAAQAMLPAFVAVASLYATIFAFRSGFDPLSSGIAVVAVVCLVLVQPPREVTTQLTSPRVSAVLDVIFRWVLILAALLGIAYVTKSPLQEYPRRVFLTWAVGHARRADRLDPRHAGIHATLPDERVRCAQRRRRRLQHLEPGAVQAPAEKSRHAPRGQRASSTTAASTAWPWSATHRSSDRSRTWVPT